MTKHMHCRTAIILFLFSLIGIYPVHSQSISFRKASIELGLNLGPSIFLGDVGGNKGKGVIGPKDINFPYTNFFGGVYAAIYPSEWLGFRGNFNIGSVAGHDAVIDLKGKEEYWRRLRNLGFKSSIVDAYVAAEFYPTYFFEDDPDDMVGKFRPYLVGGVGYYRFEPKGQYIDPVTGASRWVDLRPLRLEGQGMAEYPDRKPYNLNQLSFPLGVGFKYFINSNLHVGLEYLHRKSNTDYIDDVSTKYIDPMLFNKYLSPGDAEVARQMAYREHRYSGVTRRYVNMQRGDPKDMDSYFTFVFRIGVRLSKKNTPEWRARRMMKCPSF